MEAGELASNCEESKPSPKECRKPICADGDDSSLFADAYTLKFLDPEMEHLFVQSKQEALVKSVIQGGAAVAVLAVIITASRLHNPTLIQPEIKRLCIALFAALGMVLAKLQQRKGLLNMVGFEIAAILCCSGVLALGAFPSPYHMAQFVGIKDFDTMSGYPYQDTGTLLFIDLVITSTHLIMPFRWCVLWPLEVLAVLSYALPSFILGSPHPKDVPFNTMALACLVGFAALGKRLLEQHERRNFRRLQQMSQGCVTTAAMHNSWDIVDPDAEHGLCPGATCAAIVQLDASYNVIRGASKLAALLLFGTSRLDMSLVESLAPADCQRFKDHLSAQAAARQKAADEHVGASSGGAFVVCLHDAMQRRVLVELFCACLLDSDDTVYYIVSISKEPKGGRFDQGLGGDACDSCNCSYPVLGTELLPVQSSTVSPQSSRDFHRLTVQSSTISPQSSCDFLDENQSTESEESSSEASSRRGQSGQSLPQFKELSSVDSSFQV
jgi:hypothetical protein